MSASLPSEALTPALRADANALRLLPRSRVARLAVWLLIGAAVTLVFGAWLRPNMIFDLADMVFCN